MEPGRGGDLIASLEPRAKSNPVQTEEKEKDDTQQKGAKKNCG